MSAPLSTDTFRIIVRRETRRGVPAMDSRRRSAPISPRLVALLVLTGLAIHQAFGQVSILTHHNDNGRAGANLNETILNISTPT